MVAVAMAEDDVRQATLDSLRLIVQSQMILADLQTNQHRLEELIIDLEQEVQTDGST